MLIWMAVACADDPAPAAVPTVPVVTTPARPGERTTAQPLLPTISLLVDGTLVLAEVADTPEERAAGLMWRESLEPGQGMVFVYPDSRPRSFWMKNTLLPLSIAYISEDGVVVSVHDMVPRSERSVPSQGAARYALEVPQGWLAEHGVTKGDRIEGLPGPSVK